MSCGGGEIEVELQHGGGREVTAWVEGEKICEGVERWDSLQQGDAHVSEEWSRQACSQVRIRARHRSSNRHAIAHP